MATQLVGGPRRWSMKRDATSGHREYTIKHLIKAALTDGPANVLRTAGLPVPGSTWTFDSDLDEWATCTYEATVEPHETPEGSPTRWWTVEQKFSTKPICKEQQFENPLLEPQKISGTFQQFKEEAVVDRHGNRIKNSAHEQIRGPQNEWDATCPHIKITQNVLNLDLPLVSQMMDSLNAEYLWGLPPRTIKLSGFNWERKWYGTCFLYFVRELEFVIKYRRIAGVASTFSSSGTGSIILDPTFIGDYETFDRKLVDEGTKVLSGRWDRDTDAWVLRNIAGSPPDPNNPRHFQRFQDRQGNIARVILDGEGKPAGKHIGTGTDPQFGDPGEILVERYGESDFLLLGIPVDIEIGV